MRRNASFSLALLPLYGDLSGNVSDVIVDFGLRMQGLHESVLLNFLSLELAFYSLLDIFNGLCPSLPSGCYWLLHESPCHWCLLEVHASSVFDDLEPFLSLCLRPNFLLFRVCLGLLRHRGLVRQEFTLRRRRSDPKASTNEDASGA